MLAHAAPGLGRMESSGVILYEETLFQQAAAQSSSQDGRLRSSIVSSSRRLIAGIKAGLLAWKPPAGGPPAAQAGIARAYRRLRGAWAAERLFAAARRFAQKVAERLLRMLSRWLPVGAVNVQL